MKETAPILDENIKTNIHSIYIENKICRNTLSKYFHLFEATVMTRFLKFLVVSDLLSNKFLNRVDL